MSTMRKSKSAPANVPASAANAAPRVRIWKAPLFVLIVLLVVREISQLAEFREVQQQLAEFSSLSSVSTYRISPNPISSTSIPPSMMKTHYHEMWNYTTGTINVPEQYKNPFNISLVDEHGNPRKPPLTSLEILQEVLHGEKYKSEFEAVAVYMKRISENKTNNTNIPVPSCLAPDIKATRKLANKVVEERNSNSNNNYNSNWTLSLPIFNVGFPKVGSTTLYDYFSCLGMKAGHRQEGRAMVERLADGKSIFRKDPDQAYCQLDYNTGTGHYPQISLLDEFHEIHPDSTFVMNFRPISDWIHSANKWAGMSLRFSKFLVPGLPLTPKQVQENQEYHFLKKLKDQNVRKVTLPRIKRIEDTQIAKWWCGHVLHLREYIREYPSHALIELDLYDTRGTNSVLYDLFQADAIAMGGEEKKCWGKSNVHKNATEKEARQARQKASLLEKAE